MAARIEKHRDERDTIVRAAYGLIGRAPGETVSVAEILDVAGLSTRAFYRHFRSKDELILTMYRTAADRVLAEQRRVVATAAGPADALEATIRQQLAVVYDPRRARQTAVLSSLEVRSARGFAQADEEASARRRALLADVIREGCDDGTFPRATDPDEDARAVLSVVGGLIQARLAGNTDSTWDDATTHTTALFLRSFGARERK